ncbi:glycosyltransferase [Candidatus Woesearchaeota archaeon]|nr:glycosyltransferase [Candidatus Woesearchaeota archaeon]
MVKLSVIIPAYNEAENLRKNVLEQVASYFKNKRYSYEVIIVDDGSKDNTISLVKKYIVNKKNFKLIQNEHGGKAITVMTGLLASRGDITLFTDMDQAVPISEVEKFFPIFEKGYDMVIGLRKGRKGAPFIRKLYAYGYVVLRVLILGLPFQDTQCGFKAFNKKSIKVIFPSMLRRWKKDFKLERAAVNPGFDIETLFIAKKKGFKIVGAPVKWHYVGSERVKITTVFEGLRDMFRIRINSFLGKYD